MDSTTLIVGLILGLIIGMFIMKLTFIFEGKNMRKATLKGSRNQMLGEVYEKILPALPNFPYAPKDMVFIGKGCDYIIFDGLTEGHLREVIFLELKSGRAVMSSNEQKDYYVEDFGLSVGGIVVDNAPPVTSEIDDKLMMAYEADVYSVNNLKDIYTVTLADEIPTIISAGIIEGKEPKNLRGTPIDHTMRNMLTTWRLLEEDIT